MSNRSRGRAARPHFTLAAIVLAMLVGCVSGRGIQEFALYQSAFEKTNATSNAILDQLAVQERELFLRQHRVGVHVSAFDFDPAQAAYYTNSIDPPGTGAFRHALATVKAYNDLLYGLASGQTAAALGAKLGELQVNVGKGIAETGSLLGFGAQSTGVAAALNTAFTQLKPFVDLALKYRTRQAFRVYIVQSAPIVRTMLEQVREGTKEIFPVLTASVLRRSREDIRSGALTSDEVKKIEDYRTILADWVVLIDATILALDHTTTAAGAPATVAGSIGALSTVAVDLTTASESARRHMAELSAR